MASASYAVLREAVLRQHQVTFQFRGGLWTACPHALGLKVRREHVLSYVLRADGKSVADWRCFDVEDLIDVRHKGGGWVTSRDAMPDDCLDLVDVRAIPPPRAAMI